MQRQRQRYCRIVSSCNEFMGMITKNKDARSGKHGSTYKKPNPKAKVKPIFSAVRS